MPVSYKDIGLRQHQRHVPARLRRAVRDPAYNFNNMEQLQAIITACVETRSPVILQISSGARKYANQTLLRYMAEGAVRMAREMEKAKGADQAHPHRPAPGPRRHLRAGQSCIESGFSSVMIDGSHHPYEKNIELTRKVVEYAPRSTSPSRASWACWRASRTTSRPSTRPTPSPSRSRTS